MENKRSPNCSVSRHCCGSSNTKTASAHILQRAWQTRRHAQGQHIARSLPPSFDLLLDCVRRCTFGGLLASICPSARELRTAGTTRACRAPTAGAAHGTISPTMRAICAESTPPASSRGTRSVSRTSRTSRPPFARRLFVLRIACSRPAGRVDKSRECIQVRCACVLGVHFRHHVGRDDSLDEP